MIRLILAIVAGVVVNATQNEPSTESVAWFAECMKGPLYPNNARECPAFDLDDDGDIDLLDWADWVIEHPDGSADSSDD